MLNRVKMGFGIIRQTSDGGLFIYLGSAAHPTGLDFRHLHRNVIKFVHTNSFPNGNLSNI